MKSNYCFIRDFGRMRPGSYVYHVKVGSSDREQIKFALVQNYCQDVGIYFKKWSCEVDKTLCLAEKAWPSKWGLPISPFQHVSISIYELYKLIIEDAFETFESRPHATPAQSFFYRQFDPIGIISKLSAASNTLCPPPYRKNLSRWEQDNLGKFLVRLTIILGIVVLHGWVGIMIELLCGCK